LILPLILLASISLISTLIFINFSNQLIGVWRVLVFLRSKDILSYLLFELSQIFLNMVSHGYKCPFKHCFCYIPQCIYAVYSFSLASCNFLKISFLTSSVTPWSIKYVVFNIHVFV
jgi:hypothetical protein